MALYTPRETKSIEIKYGDYVKEGETLVCNFDDRQIYCVREKDNIKENYKHEVYREECWSVYEIKDKRITHHYSKKNIDWEYSGRNEILDIEKTKRFLERIGKAAEAQADLDRFWEDYRVYYSTSQLW